MLEKGGFSFAAKRMETEYQDPSIRMDFCHSDFGPAFRNCRCHFGCRWYFAIVSFSPIVVICTSAGALLSGFWAGKRNRSRGILWGLLCGFLMLLTEVLIGVWLMVPSYQDGQAVTKAAAMLISGAIGGILGANHTEKIK